MASGYGYDEDFNYDRSHEKSRHDQPQQSKAEAYKKQSSVGNFLKEMQQRAAQIPEESYGGDLVAKKQKKKKEKPPPEQRREIKRGNYRCDLCDVSSETDIQHEQHMSGKKHQLKVKNNTLTDNENDSALAAGGKRVRVLTLRERLQETKEPLIGLHYIEEIYPETQVGGKKWEPLYNCNLCCVTGISAIAMFSHILGFKHRQKYLEMRYNESNLEKEEVAARSANVARTEGVNIDMIKTIHSDEKYPWPPGKAPWAKDNGGSGMAPDGSRNHFYSSETVPMHMVQQPQRPGEAPMYMADRGHQQHQMNRGQQQRQPEEQAMFERRPAPEQRYQEPQSLEKSPVSHLIKGLSHCAVKNDSDAHLAHAVSKKLIRGLVSYKHKALQPPFTETLENDHRHIVKLLDLIFEIPSPKPADPSPPSISEALANPPAPPAIKPFNDNRQQQSAPPPDEEASLFARRSQSRSSSNSRLQQQQGGSVPLPPPIDPSYDAYSEGPQRARQSSREGSQLSEHGSRSGGGGGSLVRPPPEKASLFDAYSTPNPTEDQSSGGQNNQEKTSVIKSKKDKRQEMKEKIQMQLDKAGASPEKKRAPLQFNLKGTVDTRNQGPPDPSTLPAVFKGHAYVGRAGDSLLGKRPQSSSDGKDSEPQGFSDQQFQSEWKKRKAQNTSQKQPTEKDPIIPGLQDTNPLEKAYQSKLDFMDDDGEPSLMGPTPNKTGPLALKLAPKQNAPSPWAPQQNAPSPMGMVPPPPPSLPVPHPANNSNQQGQSDWQKRKANKNQGQKGEVGGQSKAEAYKKQSSVGNFLNEMKQRASKIPETQSHDEPNALGFAQHPSFGFEGGNKKGGKNSQSNNTRNNISGASSNGKSPWAGQTPMAPPANAWSQEKSAGMMALEAALERKRRLEQQMGSNIGQGGPGGPMGSGGPMGGPMGDESMGGLGDSMGPGAGSLPIAELPQSFQETFHEKYNLPRDDLLPGPVPVAESEGPMSLGRPWWFGNH